MDQAHRTGSRPALFIGSSQEGRTIAEAIQLNLDPDVESTLWTQGVFHLTAGTLESLDRASREFDFALIVLTADDLTVKRGIARETPRDNMLFEVGFFLGRLGRERTFLVLPRGVPVDLPTDLAGVTIATFSPRADGNLRAALGPACTQVKDAMLRLKGLEPPSVAAPPRVARRRRRRSLGTARTTGPSPSMHIENISVSGALLETSGEIPVDQLLDLDLELETGARVHVMAKVVRVQRPAWGRVGGVGVAFTDVDDREFDVLHAYVGDDG